VISAAFRLIPVLQLGCEKSCGESENVERVLHNICYCRKHVVSHFKGGRKVLAILYKVYINMEFNGCSANDITFINSSTAS